MSSYLKSLSSLWFDMRSICYLMGNNMHSYRSAKKCQAIRNYECVLGRNLYDNDETNSILEIRVTLHCPIFEEILSHLFLM